MKARPGTPDSLMILLDFTKLACSEVSWNVSGISSGHNQRKAVTAMITVQAGQDGPGQDTPRLNLHAPISK